MRTLLIICCLLPLTSFAIGFGGGGGFRSSGFSRSSSFSRPSTTFKSTSTFKPTTSTYKPSALNPSKTTTVQRSYHFGSPSATRYSRGAYTPIITRTYYVPHYYHPYYSYENHFFTNLLIFNMLTHNSQPQQAYYVQPQQQQQLPECDNKTIFVNCINKQDKPNR